MITEQEVNAKRLRPGDGLGGPDYYGCINSGRQPILRRYTDGFVAGPWIDVADWKDESRKSRRCLRRYKDAKFFKTKPAAVAYFVKMCAKVTAYNERATAEVKQAQKVLAKHEDPNKRLQAAFVLSDHGQV